MRPKRLGAGEDGGEVFGQLGARVDHRHLVGDVAARYVLVPVRVIGPGFGASTRSTCTLLRVLAVGSRRRRCAAARAAGASPSLASSSDRWPRPSASRATGRSARRLRGLPRPSGPPMCGQLLSSACRLPSTLASAYQRSPAMTSRTCPGGTSRRAPRSCTRWAEAWAQAWIARRSTASASSGFPVASSSSM